MKTLKVALLVTTTAGAVAAGGVTWATVGNSSPAPSAPAAVKDIAKHAPEVKTPTTPAVPAVPSPCVPNLPKGSEALAAAKAKVKKQIEALAAKAPKTPVTLPAAPGKAPKVLPAGELAKLPVSKLPTCKADSEQKAETATPPKVPAAPSLPDAVSCDKVPAVIKHEQARARQFTLPNGAKFGVAHGHSIVIQSRAACVWTQQLVGSLPGTITVDRIKTPPQVTLGELAQELKMPGHFVSVSGGNAWQTPTHDGMLWLDGNGYAVRVTGSNPATAALLPGIASQLHAE
jgi:hypothetical protein